MLGRNRYGKSGIRLVRVDRAKASHAIADLTVAVSLEGDFEAVHVAGDNSELVATDTMKNTVYALAKDLPGREIEDFALALSDHFLRESPRVSRAEVSIEERIWSRLGDTAFEGSSRERRTARAIRSREGVTLRSGLKDLLILKSAHSGFSGFARDRYTTLRETRDRLLATSLTAEWTHGFAAGPFAGRWEAVRRILLETFAAHDSASVQHTLYAMGEAALAADGGLAEIRLTMPNRHHLLVDLTPFGLTNENEIFVATEAPYGLIEATVIREGSESQST
jgi:urate oxidase